MHGAALILLAGAVALMPRVPDRFLVPLYTIASIAWLPFWTAAATPPLSLAGAGGAARSCASSDWRRRTPYVLAIALVLRLLLLFPEPRLSGDVYRYLSDGRTLAAGLNPYAYNPTDPRVNHPEIRSIYPPHAQLLFGLVHELHAWRALVIAFDLLAIVLLRERGLAYATCPLVLIEGTWSGHIDAIAGVFLLVALLKRSGLAAGIAAGLKIIPLATVPALFGRRIPLSFFLALLVPFLPFLGGPIMPGMRDYATRWIFNSPLYELVFAIVERVPTKTIWTHHPLRVEPISDLVYRHLYPDFVTRAVMATLAVTAILLARRVSTAIAALLLCSPTIHPWYWLTLVPAALVERTRWMLVALAAPASYLLYGGASKWIVFALCYALAVLPNGVVRASGLPLRGRP